MYNKNKDSTFYMGFYHVVSTLISTWCLCLHFGLYFHVGAEKDSFLLQLVGDKMANRQMGAL
jgi:hypothetical protein